MSVLSNCKTVQHAIAVKLFHRLTESKFIEELVRLLLPDKLFLNEEQIKFLVELIGTDWFEAGHFARPRIYIIRSLNK